MARKLEQFAFKRGKKNPVPPYDWARWQDGGIWQATREVDFVCTPEHFMQYLHRRARLDQKRVRVHVKDDVVTFQFYERECLRPVCRQVDKFPTTTTCKGKSHGCDASTSVA